jgi:hypothetical protein
MAVVKQVPWPTRDALLDPVEAAVRMAEGSVMQCTLEAGGVNASKRSQEGQSGTFYFD